jgi:hypothetical protein
MIVAIFVPLLTIPAATPMSRYDQMNFIFNVLLYKVAGENPRKLQIPKHYSYYILIFYA